MNENERLAQAILYFCRVMLLHTDQATAEDIINDFLEFIRKENLK